MHGEPRELLRHLFETAVGAVRAESCLPPHLPEPPAGRLVVVGAGKAAAAMARVVEEQIAGDLSGLVVTRRGYELPCRRIEVVAAAHPVPDAAGMAAAARTLRLVEGLAADDLVLVLLSGGGSALWPLPASGIGLEDKQRLLRVLLNCGASIAEINCVRRHLSAIKGGRLATACAPARVLSLLISDVPGDRPLDIASGPTVADPTTCDDTLAVLRRHDVPIPPAVRALLESGGGESVKPGDLRLAAGEVRVIASARLAVEAAANAARAAGIGAYVLADDVEGESREVAKVMAALARQATRPGGLFRPPCVLLSGGETTVRVHGGGVGGPNAEFLLALAIALDGHPRIHALAADTDGIDGGAEIAGALLAPDTLARAHAEGLDARTALAENDAHGFFQTLGDSLVSGPTFTNVSDFRALLIS